MKRSNADKLQTTKTSSDCQMPEITMLLEPTKQPEGGEAFREPIVTTKGDKVIQCPKTLFVKC